MGDQAAEVEATVQTDRPKMVEADLEQARAAEKKTSDRLKLIRAKCRFLEGVREYDEAASPGALWLFLADQERTLQRIERGGGTIPLWLDDLREDLRSRLKELARAWPSEFAAALDDEGLEPDRGSRHPTYTFMSGFLSIQVDERKLSVRLDTRNGPQRLLPLDPVLVAGEVRQTRQRLLDRDFDADAFLSELLAAYHATGSETDAASGEEQRLPAVLERLSKDQERPGDEVLIDLGRLLQQGTPEHEGRKLRLGHTRRDKDGVLVPGFENGGYLGFIAFRTEGENR